MSAHALIGLVALNLLFLASGIAFLWSIRGWTSWSDVGRLGGLAYLCGVALAGCIWSLLLIVGVPFSGWLVVGVPATVTTGSAFAARRRDRAWPTRGSTASRASLVASAVGATAVGLLLEGSFRTARLPGLQAWDAWSFWIPKAKAVYYFGGLDEQFFTTLPGSSYPPLVPALDAAAFHLMGGPDVVTIHVQYWFLGAGFFWAIAGLLSERVMAWMLWPFLLLGLVAPRIGGRLTIPEADLLLDFLFVVASVLVVVWILDRARWRLVVATVLLCGMVLTKREGLLLGALLVAAALIASSRTWRATFPALGISAAAVVAVALPWRLWYVDHDLAGEGPTGGFVQQDRLDWLWPSARRALEVLATTGYWNVLVPLAVCALVLAALARARVLPLFFGSLLVLVTLGGVWATWVFSTPLITGELGGNFIIRFMGSAALLCLVATPLLLSAAWQESGVEVKRGPRVEGGVALAAAATLAIPLAGYPLLAYAQGAPRFPSRDDCARPYDGAPGEPVDVVYARLDDPVSATDLLDELSRHGFIGADIAFDSCGRWVVFYDPIESVEQAEALAEQVRNAGFEARVEAEP